MSGPRLYATLGGLWDIGLMAAARRVTVEVALPMGELDRVLRGIGLPPPLDVRESDWQDGSLPALAIFPARAPRHPEDETEVLAESAVHFLIAGIESGALRLTPGLSRQFDTLRERLDGMPIIFPLPVPEAP